MTQARNTVVLLVIDVLQDFFREGPLAKRREALTDSTTELVDSIHARNSRRSWFVRSLQTT